VSGDGNTAVVGGPGDGTKLGFTLANTGAIWFFTRIGGAWVQSGDKFTGPSGTAFPIGSSDFGATVAISSDGATAITGVQRFEYGGPASVANGPGAFSVYVRVNGVWSEQADLLQGSGASGNGAQQGASVAISADGNLAVVGGPYDGHTVLQEGTVGAVWVWERVNGAWAQLQTKLVGTGYQGFPLQGSAVAISGDGSTILEIGPADTGGASAWFFVYTPPASCTYSLSTGVLAVPSIAGGQTVSVMAGANCTWSASSNASWITVTPPGSGTANGTVSFTFAPNTSGAQRSGTVMVAGQTLTITQLGATPIPVFPTGIVNGALPPFANVDSHYTLISSTDSTFSGPNAIVAGGASLPAEWLPDGPNSKWISPREDANAGNAAGLYTYRTTFDLTGMSAAGASLSGRWATDATGIIKLNGVPAGSTSSSSSQYTPFLIGSGFVSGVNTLDFVVTNSAAAHPTGVRVELSGATTPATAADQLPAPVSVTPASSRGGSQSFVFTFSDPRGWQDLAVVNVLINSALDGRAACYLAFVRNTGALYLVDDAGDSGGPYNGLSNSQCSITSSSFAGNGNTLSLTLAILFKSQSSTVVYAAARDNKGNNSGWQAMGTWNLPAGPAGLGPSVDAGTSISGSGTSHTFTFVFDDSNGAGDLRVMDVLINRAVDGRAACYFAFVPSGSGTGSLYLVDDAGDAGGPYGGLALPGVGAVQNSQCSISGAGFMTNPGYVTVTVTITFSQAFRGNQIVYAAARSATLNSGWLPIGTWTVQ
jgi:hypothetical protein